MPKAFTQTESQRIRALLLEVASAQLQLTGFRKTSVDALARAAGISKGSFYLFFDSKVALWMALLGGAEEQARAQLLAIADDKSLTEQDCLRAVFACLFASVQHHPLLRALADPLDMAWLVRALPEGALEQARADDALFFGKLRRRLLRRGALRKGVSPRLFGALPAAALALVQGRALIGDDDFEALVAFQIRAWSEQLRA